MLVVQHPSDLASHIDRPIGPGEWETVTQDMVDRFAEVTGDHQWIHVDVGRAEREAPNGKTIAHGFLVLSLVGKLLPPLYEVRGATRIFNYGINRLRFLSPVPTGSRIRALLTFKNVEPASGGYRSVFELTIEIEGQSKPALVSEHIVLYFD